MISVEELWKRKGSKIASKELVKKGRKESPSSYSNNSFLVVDVSGMSFVPLAAGYDESFEKEILEEWDIYYVPQNVT